VVFFPSEWWFPTHHNPEADVTIRAWGGWSPGQALTCSYSQLARAFYQLTPLAFTGLCGPEADAEYVRRTFAGLRHVPASSARPTFVFAHVLSPHPPYVLDRICRTEPRVPLGLPTPDERAGYIEQLQCVNHLVLGLVRELRARSRVPPVILLQGDHGPNAARPLSPNLLLREVFGAFGAYYLPAGGDRLFPDSVTLVNVLPRVFNYYLGTGLPMQQDDLYQWDERADSLQLIDPRLLDSRMED
jgi:hypothetical protein